MKIKWPNVAAVCCLPAFFLSASACTTGVLAASDAAKANVSHDTSISDIVASQQSLNADDLKMVDWIEQREQAMLDELAAHINMNTATDNIAGLDAYRAILDAELTKLGFASEQRSSPPMQVLSCNAREIKIADHLIARRTGNKKHRIFLNGHMDTVFPLNDAFQSLVIEKDGTLRGPGVADMKGGIVALLYALRALHAHDKLDNSNITVLFNSDEEIGSLGSRSIVEELARQHDIGFVFESSHENRFTRARKGLGQARLKITGRESHAGAAHGDGVSANRELAHKVLEIEDLTDYPNKVTVNVGTMQGGEKRNTVPGCADAYIDMRYPSGESGKKLQASIEKIAGQKTIRHDSYPDLPKIESWTVLHRPAKEQHALVDQLIADAMGLSKLIGEPIEGSRYSGGGTDGSIAQSVGLPTIDSMGLDGAGAHSNREKSSVASLMARAKLIAVMLARQTSSP